MRKHGYTLPITCLIIGLALLTWATLLSQNDMVFFKDTGSQMIYGSVNDLSRFIFVLGAGFTVPALYKLYKLRYGSDRDSK